MAKNGLYEKAKGRRAADRKHVRLYLSMMETQAWREASPTAIKALIYLAGFENGGNNGGLFLSVRTLAQGINCSRKTALRALTELEQKGFIAATARGHFHVKGGPATSWRLTWLPWPAGRMSATNDFARWQPVEKTRE